MNVVIVESAAKAKTINKYLGSGYKVIPSFGHVRDLPPKNGSVEPENDFAMHWDVDSKSQKIIKEIESCDPLYCPPWIAKAQFVAQYCTKLLSECLWSVDKIVSALDQIDDPFQLIIPMKSFNDLMTNPNIVSLTPRIREQLLTSIQESKRNSAQIEWIVTAISGATAFTSDEQIQSAILSIIYIIPSNEILRKIQSDSNLSKNPEIAAILKRLLE